MVRIHRGQDLGARVAALISEKKQVAEYSLDLTVAGIRRVTGAGALDFGGSEYQPGIREDLLPRKGEQEAYGWWELQPGTYLLRFNEALRIPEKCLAVVRPHPRLLATGAFHPTLVLERWDPGLEVPLHVGPPGLRLKENARVSQVIVFE